MKEVMKEIGSDEAFYERLESVNPATPYLDREQNKPPEPSAFKKGSENPFMGQGPHW